ncbi:MAG: hypothetical protein BWY20_02205 [Spirochaetes bacterium ADurb.Bin215]|nr:MAG: hypothetical protein BWY20_02205 [Spirochaetes bacterium ADurb.Bin215]
MGGTVFSEEDGVVGKNVHNRQVHERGEAERRSEIIRENQEGRAERAESAMNLDTIGDGGHTELAYSVV